VPKNHCTRRYSVVHCERFEQGAEWGGSDDREAFPDAEVLMAKGGPETAERESQKLISVVAAGASESASCNQLIKCKLLKMKNGEMRPQTLDPQTL